jgi:hypothetical protein
VKIALRNVRISAVLVFTLLAACYALFSAESIDLLVTGDDLGRHLKNGELLLSSSTADGTVSKLLHTNFYSFSNPESEFINHHWLAGVVYFLVWKAVGFAGLNAFYILLGTVTFLLFFHMAQQAAGLAFAATLAVVLMPILRVRPSVRPEIFSLLFCAIFLWFLWKYHNGLLHWRMLLALPVMEILWVNLHIGFIYGPTLIAAFLLDELFSLPPSPEFQKDKLLRLKQWLIVLGLTLVATLINPSGIEGALHPFTIWTNYGIQVQENQSVLSLQRLGYRFDHVLIEFTLGALYLSFLPAIRYARRFPWALLALALLFGAMAWSAIRNQTIFALFALMAISANAGACGFRELFLRRKTGVALALGLILPAGAYCDVRGLIATKEQVGLGLRPGTDAAADFLRGSHLEGPLLNDFNLGGYLIFYLFPQYRVFVDSRPEAYPASFLHERYIAALTNEDVWAQLQEIYRFNIIVFSAATTWENQFANRRVEDKRWAVVYSDRAIAILARRTPANRSFIERYEIPKERLSKH